jgi:PKD repeat protein
VTTYVFTAKASDPDNDPLSYAWDFGDGQTTTGQNVPHTFPEAKTYTVALTTTDGRGGSETVTRDVPVGTLAGNWSVRFGNSPDTARIGENQNGRNIVGHLDTANLSFSGIVTDPRNVQIMVLYSGCTGTYTGSAAEDLRSISVSGDVDCDGAKSSISFSR